MTPKKTYLNPLSFFTCLITLIASSVLFAQGIQEGGGQPEEGAPSSVSTASEGEAPESTGVIEVMEMEPRVQPFLVDEGVSAEFGDIETEEGAEEEDEGSGDAIQVSSARNLMYEAMLDVQDGNNEIAIPKFEKVLEEDPTLMGAWETLGWSYWLTGREEDAVALWTQLIEIAPNEPIGYNLLAQVQTRDANMKEAQRLYRKSLELNPDQFEIRVNYARVTLWDGQWEEGIVLFRELLEEQPDRIDVEIDYAWSLYGNEQYEDSLKHWNNVVEAIPGHAGFLVARADVHLLMGMLLEAELDALAALELEPDNLRATNILISLSMKNNQPRQTIERLTELLDRVDDTEMKIRVAEQIAIYMDSVYKEDPGVFTLEEVIRAGKETWELDKTLARSALFYGEILVRGQEFGQALNIFDYILDELNPNNERARTGKLESYLGMAKFDEAEEQLVENLRLFNGENPFRHLTWSRIHFGRGDFQLAMKALDRLEREGARGSVLTLLYHGISPSEFSDMPSVRQLREQLIALKRDGWEFMTPSGLPAYFDSIPEPPPTESDRPWLNRVVESVKYSWSAEEPEDPELLRDVVPDKKVIVTFDDSLRNSFRYGTIVADELDVKFTMFAGVGDIIMPGQRYVSSFAEIREYDDTGHWEIQSHLWDGGQLFRAEKDGPRKFLPLPNQLWVEDEDRLESLREYQLRLRKEFADSKAVLARELGVDPDEITSVAYPYGDIGQENSTNIEFFPVTPVILNEAAISYERGFIQNNFGYAMRADNPLLYKRFEPYRHASGRYVLRQAYLQHPIFVARRTRAEIAALNGLYDLAMENVELLRRDGYPEEDLRELTKYVDRQLASLVQLPDAVEDTAAEDNRGEDRDWIEIENPFIGVDARTVRANDVIDEEEIGIFAGLNINRRTTLQVRATQGKIEQSFNTETNRVIEVFRSSTGTSTRRFNQVIDGRVFRVEENSSFTDTLSFQSNVVEEIEFKADYTREQGLLSYIHDSGAFSIFQVGYYTLDLDRNGRSERTEKELTYSANHQWRPFPNLDFDVAFVHDVVPSARELISYDQLYFRPVWRVTDSWQASGIGSFSFFDDNNSYLTAEIENIWLISEKLDIWAGFHSSVSTTDEESELYYSPYWEQRHYAIFELRRRYPGFTSSFRGHLGFQKERARDEDIAEFLNTQATAEEQGGFSAGEGPDEDWGKLLGFSATLSKTFDWGLEINATFLVNATREYTEHNVYGSALYRF